MSLALSTNGIIPQENSKIFSLRGFENMAVIRSTGGIITVVGFADVSPGHDLEVSISFDDVAITVYPNGLEQRISGVAAGRKQFNLTFPVLPTAEVDELWNLYLGRHGPLYPFVFISPQDNQRYLVRFAIKSMSRTLFAYMLESTGLNLMEVLGE